MVNPYGLTDDEMILLEAMDLQERCIIHGEVDKRHWRKEGKHHGAVSRRCGPIDPHGNGTQMPFELRR